MRILVVTSTLPKDSTDPVPAFVRDQAIWLKKQHPDLEITILAPHNAYSQTKKFTHHDSYDEYRFHYFWPFRWELLAGRGILPALRQNRWLYFQIPFLCTAQFIALWRLTRRQKPDLLYAHWFTPQAISAALVSFFTRTPFIFTTHASDVAVLRKLPFSRHLVTYVCNRAAAFTAVSERTAIKLRSFFDNRKWDEHFAHKLAIIPMGVATSIPAVTKDDILRMKREFRIPDSKESVLFMGRLAEKKGVPYLLEAFSQLPIRLQKSLHLIIAGDGQQKEMLIKLAKDMGLKNITFTGYLNGSTKDAVFAMADFACFPSIIDDSGDSEGFPVVLMESLAAGKIVLASDVTGAETILEQGKSGFIFPEKSAQKLAATLEQAVNLTKAQQTPIQKAAKRLARQFDWDTIAQHHYRVFKEVINENSAR